MKTLFALAAPALLVIAAISGCTESKSAPSMKGDSMMKDDKMMKEDK